MLAALGGWYGWRAGGGDIMDTAMATLAFLASLAMLIHALCSLRPRSKPLERLRTGVVVVIVLACAVWYAVLNIT